MAFTERTASAGRENVAITVINRDARSASDTGRSTADVYDGVTILLIARARDNEFTLFFFFFMSVDRILRSVFGQQRRSALCVYGIQIGCF